MLQKRLYEIREHNLHDRSHHTDIHHNPPKGNADPVLAKVHSQTVREETADHAGEGEPHAVQAIFGPPIGAVALVDPVVEDEADGPA